MADSLPPRRVNSILSAAVALVAVLALALVVALIAGASTFDTTRSQLAALRASRDAAIALTSARTEVIDAERAFPLDNRAEHLAAARAHADQHLAVLRGACAGNDTALAHLTRLEALMTQLFATLDRANTARQSRRSEETELAALGADIERETAALQEAVLTRADLLIAEASARHRRLDLLAGALALLLLTISVLAILALQRRWRVATDAVELARAKADGSELAKSRFLAVASHDLRQPLHAIGLYISALKRRVDNAEARDILAKMERATQSMVGMFAALLDLARVQAGVVKPDLSVVRLQDLVDRISAAHPAHAIDAPQTSVWARTDPLLLERLLSHLVSNALRHGGGMARIEVSTSRDLAEISVVDDGAGIAPEDQARIFDEFVRMDQNSEGLGLGLAIVRRIADALEIPLELHSAPGAGARLTVRVPIAEAEEAPARTH